MTIALSNTRQLFEYGNKELAYEVALRAADVAEHIVLLARALPAYTGNPLAAQEVEALMQINIPVEIGFTAEGWFSVRLPLLLPKREMDRRGISVPSSIRPCGSSFGEKSQCAITIAY